MRLGCVLVVLGALGAEGAAARAEPPAHARQYADLFWEVRFTLYTLYFLLCALYFVL